MARPLKPSAIKELNGSFKHDPQRRNKDEPQPTGGIGPWIEHRPVDKAAIWDELVEISAPGVLTNMDRVWLEMTVELLHKFRIGEATSPDIKDLITMLSRIGMNPSDRQRVGVVPGTKKKNPFEGAL